MWKPVLLGLIVSCSSLCAQNGITTTTYYQNGDVVENAAASTDTIRTCGMWTGIGRVENGLKEGYWKYFRSGIEYYSGTYRKGKKEGAWKTEDPEGVVHYENDLLEGEVVYYFTGTTIVQERRHYHQGKAHGDWIAYSQATLLPLSIRHYSNGVPVGSWQILSGEVTWKGSVNEFGENGPWTASVRDTVLGGGMYVNGIQEGIWTEVGSRYTKSVGQYKNGLREGLWRSYHFDKLQTSREFLHDQRHGGDTSWVMGYLTYTFHWYEGERDGLSAVYFSGGQKKMEWLFDRVSRSQTYKEFDENGSLLTTGTYSINPDYLIVEQNREKQCRVFVPFDYELELVEKGVCWGGCSSWGNEPPDITVDSIVRYYNSEQYKKDTAGPHRPFDTPQYIRTGVWTFYYPGGKKKEEGEYLPEVKTEEFMGEPIYLKTGWWKVYAENGTLLRDELYENGLLVETRDRNKKK